MAFVVSLGAILKMGQINADSTQIEDRKLENENWPQKYPIYARLIEDDKTGNINDWLAVTEREDADTRAINDAWTSLVVAYKVAEVYRNQSFFVLMVSLSICGISLIRHQRKLRRTSIASPSKL
jgi:hypothetical protein